MRWGKHRHQPVAELHDDGTLRTFAAAVDPAAGDAVALGALTVAGWDGRTPLLVRHQFVVPDGRVWDQLAAVLAEDDWALGPLEGERAIARATQVPTVLSLAQARARMTGLETRLAVRYLGWEAAGR